VSWKSCKRLCASCGDLLALQQNHTSPESAESFEMSPQQVRLGMISSLLNTAVGWPAAAVPADLL